jgi:hypothetical protein
VYDTAHVRLVRPDKWGGVFTSLPDFALAPACTALVIVDMQYLDAHRDYAWVEATKQGTGRSTPTTSVASRH